MQSQLLEEASQVIQNPQVLINIISRRVRQLSQGHRSMVEIRPRMGFSDIALTEVIEGKLGYEATSEYKAEPLAERIIDFVSRRPQARAA